MRRAVAVARGTRAEISAYTIGFERGLVSVDGAPAKSMKTRVTHLYRRIEGRWVLVHRHADFPPTDPRSASSR